MIITFANQKGGVGKTSLLTLFANYLASKGERPLLVDIDLQRSLMGMRIQDEKTFPDQEVPYEIIECFISEPREVTPFLRELKQDNRYILIDSPGSLSDKTLTQYFAESDYIVIPYQYERKCLESTGAFLSAILQLNQFLNNRGLTFPKMLFVPNMVRPQEGLKNEKDTWKLADEALAVNGLVLPKINLLSCLKRVNTLYTNRAQSVATKEYVEQLYSIVCQPTS